MRTTVQISIASFGFLFLSACSETPGAIGSECPNDFNCQLGLKCIEGICQEPPDVNPTPDAGKAHMSATLFCVYRSGACASPHAVAITLAAISAHIQVFMPGSNAKRVPTDSDCQTSRFWDLGRTPIVGGPKN